MKKYVKSSSQSALLYFEAYQVDNIGELVADNLTHMYRSQGADFHYVDGTEAYNYDTGKNRITIRCQVSSHYDPEINKNSRYGAYLDSMDGKTFEATHIFDYNRYDTQETMGRQIVIILTDDIEDQILKASGVMGCSDIKASTDISDGEVKFFYNGTLLGTCDPYDMDCDKLFEVMQSDKVLCDLILEYLNSFGDPLFSISEEDWGTPETDSSKIDTWNLYNTFMEWLRFEYREAPEDFYVDISVPRSGEHTLEIFNGPAVE